MHPPPLCSTSRGCFSQHLVPFPGTILYKEEARAQVPDPQGIIEFNLSHWGIDHLLNHQKGGQVVSDSQKNVWK